MDYVKKHKLIVIVAVIVLVGIVWWGMSSSSSSGPVLSTGAPAGAAGSAATAPTPLSNDEQDLVATLLTLRAVNLDGTIFSDPDFISLRDFSTEIVQEPVGRPNPFAPLPGQGAAQTKSNAPAKAKLP